MLCEHSGSISAAFGRNHVPLTPSQAIGFYALLQKFKSQAFSSESMDNLLRNGAGNKRLSGLSGFSTRDKPTAIRHWDQTSHPLDRAYKSLSISHSISPDSSSRSEVLDWNCMVLSAEDCYDLD